MGTRLCFAFLCLCLLHQTKIAALRAAGAMGGSHPSRDHRLLEEVAFYISTWDKNENLDFMSVYIFPNTYN